MRQYRRWTSFAVVTLLSLLPAGGCRVNHDEERGIYREILDLPAHRHESEQSLSLRDALLLANRNNEELSMRGEQYFRSWIARRRTVANFLPTVNLVASAVERDRVSSSNGDGGSSNDSTFDVSGQLNWNLFNGFRDVNRYWRDTYLIEQSRNELLSFQESLLLDVAATYYQILRSEASVHVLENSLAVQEERLRDTQGRLDAGVARPLDLAQTQAQVSATRTILINARRDVSNARDVLELLIAFPVHQASLVDEFELPARIGELDAYLEAAMNARHDLQAGEMAILAARREVEVAIGQYYPTVALNLEAFVYRETVPDERDWTGLLVANVPIFAAGRIRADVREAWSFFREALLVRSILYRQVRQQVRQAYHDLAASESRLSELQVQLRAAEQASRQAEASYRVGLATNLERVAAQDALLSAQLQLASEEFDRKVLYLILLRSSGLLREDLEGKKTEGVYPSMDEGSPSDGSMRLKPVTQPAVERE